jgi:hypothetical protein
MEIRDVNVLFQCIYLSIHPSTSRSKLLGLGWDVYKACCFVILSKKDR